MTLATYHYSSDPSSSSSFRDHLSTELSSATSTHNQYYQPLPLSKLPFDANDYLNLELDEDFIRTNGGFMNDYNKTALLGMLLTQSAKSYQANPTSLTVCYEEDEEDYESVGNDEFDDIEDSTGYTTTAATSHHGSVSEDSIKKSRSFASFSPLQEDQALMGSQEEQQQQHLPDDIQIDLSAHFKHENEFTGVFHSFSSDGQDTPLKDFDDILAGQELNWESIHSLLKDVDEAIKSPIQGDDQNADVSPLMLNTSHEQGMLFLTFNIVLSLIELITNIYFQTVKTDSLDVNHIDFKCNCLTKYNKLCKNSILCFKHTLEEKSKVPRFDPDIENVIKTYKVIQEDHALELKKLYKLDKKIEKNLKKELSLKKKAAKEALLKISKKSKSSSKKSNKKQNTLKPLQQPGGVDIPFLNSLTEKLSHLPDDLDERLNDFNHRLHLNTLILTQAFTQDIPIV
ncbi:hypothetical protein WICPIJ_000780 [Wickerhamomyces pijperi]|uniref:SCA7 domain-containing protein n=1 Tax=Wickerhamomyces pijperi TaxID=599730 RepID=A0A9P8QFJ4_WICPI|nr:hypothetical protein WICPIJ_000780 [Wickerhamomyces pijperi]